jgi:hypothetical protein
MPSPFTHQYTITTVNPLSPRGERAGVRGCNKQFTYNFFALLQMLKHNHMGVALHTVFYPLTLTLSPWDGEGTTVLVGR